MLQVLLKVKNKSSNAKVFAKITSNFIQDMMTISQFLVRNLPTSFDNAHSLILQRLVEVNGEFAHLNQEIDKYDVISCQGQLLQKGIQPLYLAFYKPVGIECTHNENIPGNLVHYLRSQARFIPHPANQPELPIATLLQQHLFPIGRLDKATEGLLLLTNNGKLYQQIASDQSYKEKEYDVQTHEPISPAQIAQLAAGVVILGNKMTRPAPIQLQSANAFSIILTQGLNRQIRRMCHKVGLNVSVLKRTRIASLQLNDLQPGEFRLLTPAEIEALV